MQSNEDLYGKNQIVEDIEDATSGNEKKFLSIIRNIIYEKESIETLLVAVRSDNLPQYKSNHLNIMKVSCVVSILALAGTVAAAPQRKRILKLHKSNNAAGVVERGLQPGMEEEEEGPGGGPGGKEVGSPALLSIFKNLHLHLVSASRICIMIL